MCHSDFFCVLSVVFYRRFQFEKKEIQISKIVFSVRVERYIPTTECSHSLKHFADVWDDLLCTVKLRYFNSTGVFRSDSSMTNYLSLYCVLLDNVSGLLLLVISSCQGHYHFLSVSRSLDIALKAKIIHLRSRFAALDSCQMSVGQMVKFSLFLSNSIIAWRAKSRSLSGNSSWFENTKQFAFRTAVLYLESHFPWGQYLVSAIHRPIF